nr:MAG TPA: hypothetical protein [Caudoviricetes sp.]
MKSLINGLKHGRLKDDKVRKGLFLYMKSTKKGLMIYVSRSSKD